MCYTVNMPTNSPHCSQCGSSLILVSTVTELQEGYHSPQINRKYRCSNAPCQEEKDRQAAKRLQMKLEKEAAMAKRAQEKREEKQEKKAAI